MKKKRNAEERRRPVLRRRCLGFTAIGGELRIQLILGLSGGYSGFCYINSTLLHILYYLLLLIVVVAIPTVGCSLLAALLLFPYIPYYIVLYTDLYAQQQLLSPALSLSNSLIW